MKIVVYNPYDQYTLSRRQVGKLRDVMPQVFWSKIAEFHLCDDMRCVEVLEFEETSKTVYFSFPVKEKTPEVVERRYGS